MKKPRAVQVAGDMDPFSYGGVFAHTRWYKGRGADITLIRIESIADHIGEAEALEYELPFWVSTADVDYSELVSFVADDNIHEALCRDLGEELQRPKCGRRHIKDMIQYYLCDDSKSYGSFEGGEDDVLHSFSFRGFRGDALGRELRRAQREHTLARLRVRYDRHD